MLKILQESFNQSVLLYVDFKNVKELKKKKKVNNRNKHNSLKFIRKV